VKAFAIAERTIAIVAGMRRIVALTQLTLRDSNNWSISLRPEIAFTITSNELR